MVFPHSIRALSHRNFRLYFFGQGVSVLGSWVQQVALSWLIYDLTGSAALLGVTAFCAQVPQLVVGPFAGAWVDKQDKKKWLLRTQLMFAAVAFVMAGLTASGHITPTLIVALTLAHGLINSFDTPLRQSLIGQFVGQREHLPNAVALNSMLFNIGRFIGPPIAGLLLAVMSEAVCFALNGLSFLGLFIGVWRTQIVGPARASGSVGQVFQEGVAYVWHTWPIRTLIMTLMVVNLTASSYAVLLPVFARDVFAGDAQTLGWLWGAAGCGSALSSVLLANSGIAGLVRLVMLGVCVSAAALLLFVSNTYLPLALLAMALLGFGISVNNVSINMLLQSSSPEHLRGRIVSFFASSRFGFDALGGLIAGLLASVLSARTTLLIEGAVLVVFAGLLLSWRARLGTSLNTIHAQENPS